MDDREVLGKWLFDKYNLPSPLGMEWATDASAMELFQQDADTILALGFTRSPPRAAPLPGWTHEKAKEVIRDYAAREAKPVNAFVATCLSLHTPAIAIALEEAFAPPVTGGWRDISTAPKDREIIYRANRNGFYVSSCQWREPDEGNEGGWWDDACTEFAAPIGWMEMPK